jgi:hypothetical protein
MARRESVAWRWLRLRDASRALLERTRGMRDDDALLLAREAVLGALGAVDAILQAETQLEPPCDCCGGPHPDEFCPQRTLRAAEPIADPDILGVCSNCGQWQRRSNHGDCLSECVRSGRVTPRDPSRDVTGVGR